MFESRNLVTKYITWEVNNGFSVNFWTDSWCGHPPISQMDNMEDIMNIAIAHWGIKLSDYVSIVEILLGKTIWKDPTLLPISNQQSSSLADIFLNRTVLMSNREDVIIWVASKSRKYSIKEGYKATQQGCSSKVSSRAYTFYLNDIVLPKAGCFVWLTLNKRILIANRLVKLGFSQVFNCVLCGLEEESVDHLFLHCTFASQCWFFIMNKLKVLMPFPKSLWDMFNSWPLLFLSSIFSGNQKCAPALIIWAIWW